MCCHTKTGPSAIRALVCDYTGAHLSQPDWHQLLDQARPCEVSGRNRADLTQVAATSRRLLDALGVNDIDEGTWFLRQMEQAKASTGTLAAANYLADQLRQPGFTPVGRRLRKDSADVTARELLGVTHVDSRTFTERRWLRHLAEHPDAGAGALSALSAHLSFAAAPPARVLVTDSGLAVFYPDAHGGSGVVMRADEDQWRVWPVRASNPAGFGTLTVAEPDLTWTSPHTLNRQDFDGLVRFL